MIDTRNYKKYVECDGGCGEELEADNFQDALDAIKSNGWTAKTFGGEWCHYCPSCAVVIDGP